jgi:hypothetical protein
MKWSTKGKRRTALESAAQAMFGEDFAGRILTFDCDAAVDDCGVTVANPWSRQ